MSISRKIYRTEMIQCLICENAPCTHACPHFDPAKELRAIWFGNEKVASLRLPDPLPCASCDAPCEGSCVRPHEVPIRRLMCRTAELKEGDVKLTPEDEALLKTDICGIPVENPFLLSSSVVSSTYDMCARAFEAGWAGAAFKTICLMDIHEASPRFSCIKSDSGTIIGFKNIEQLSDHALVENLDIFRRLKHDYPNKFLLASIMGRDEEEWAWLAHEVEKTGADALELNFSCPNMTEEGTGSDVGQVPELVARYTRAVKNAVHIPVLAKLTPNVNTMVDAAFAAVHAGADGIAAINTIKSLMDMDPDSFEMEPNIRGKTAVGGLSGQAVRPIALRFIYELAQYPELNDLHISGMGGVETWKDALEFIALGADSVQVTTAVMEYGYRIIEDLKDGLIYFMKTKGITDFRTLVSAALNTVVDTEDLERDTMIYPSFNRKTCIGCERCYVSCRDGGHQAITPGADRKPVLDPAKCVGCHLCVLICPTESITSSGVRVKKKAG